MKIRDIKKNARGIIKKHYIVFVLACVLVGILGVEYNLSFSSTSAGTEQIGQIIELIQNGGSDTEENVSEVIEEETESEIKTTIGYDDGIIDIFQQFTEGNERIEKIFAQNRGVFASLVNGASQGKMYVIVLDAVLNIVKEPGIAKFVMLLFSVMFTFMFWALFKNMMLIVNRRVFLEARIYEKVPYTSFFHFFYIKKWLITAWNMIVYQVREALWWFTIIGGPIKHYAYIMTPYICCEYPDINIHEAIALSQRMMKGHKWEMFKLELSFIGWDILAGLTWGITAILYSNPYHAAAEVEYYAYIRKISKENQIQGSEVLRDEYLHTKADETLLKETYADMVTLYSQPRVESEYMKGFRKKIAWLTSIVWFVDDDILAVEKIRNEKNYYRDEMNCAEGLAYPNRLGPIPEEQCRNWIKMVNYNRYYSIWNLIMMFMTFCFIGWCWEVSLHLITDGVFVNRGMLHGPWIPIYGAGGILILIVLARFRKYPVAEFTSAIVLCGFLEYMTSYFVELSKGKRWWDYTGYFMNLDGRICAEGLLVFGVMGMMIVYAVGPVFDHYLRQAPRKIIVPLSLILVTVFTADSIYSSKHPNEGKGITDYDAYIEEQTSTVRTLETDEFQIIKYG